MEKYVYIHLKDIDYCDDDFEYPRYIVKKEKDFSVKFNKLKRICNNYEDYSEIEEFINNNFTSLNLEERIIEI